MKQISFFSLIIFHFLCSGLSAQILKVDKGSIDADSANYFLGSINADFNLNNRSATEEEEITFRGLAANADLVYVAEKHAYILINTINYFKSTGGPLISTGFTHFRVNWGRKRKLSYENFTQIQFDDGRNMPFRFLMGGGLRLNLKRKKKASFYTGIGIMFEREEWTSVAQDSRIEREIWKTTNYISGRFTFNDYVNMKIIAYYQGGYDKVSDLFRNRISGDFSLGVKLTDKLSFVTNFSLQYEDRPIIPINNFVYSLTNGLKWDF